MTSSSKPVRFLKHACVGTILSCTALLTTVAACSQANRTPPQESAPNTSPAFDSSKHSKVREHYQVINIGTTGTPLPNSTQARWLLRVVTNPYWASRVRDLWFMPSSSQNNALIVFFAHGSAYPNVAYQVIGDPCGTWIYLSKDLELYTGPAGGSDQKCPYDPFDAANDPSAGNSPWPVPTPMETPSATLIKLLKSIASLHH